MAKGSDLERRMVEVLLEMMDDADRCGVSSRRLCRIREGAGVIL
jgi:hypothetical protein